MSSSFPADTAAFEVPGLADAMDLLDHMQARWCAWCENSVSGTFVIVLVPEAVSELDDVLAEVESWIGRQAFLAIRFYLDGRIYIMQRGGFIGAGNPA
jgi:hypothetical protein